MDPVVDDIERYSNSHDLYDLMGLFVSFQSQSQCSLYADYWSHY